MNKMYIGFSKTRSKSKKNWLGFVCVLIIILVAYCVAGKQEESTDKPKKTYNAYQDTIDHHLHSTFNSLEANRDFTLYFMKVGSKSPQKMAEAVLHTKSPRLVAAVAAVESDGNHHIRNRGYKNRHHGAWQINPKFWGAVSHEPIEQALQAEDVLEALVTDTKNIKVALAKYGGDSTDNYSNEVLTELINTPMYSNEVLTELINTPMY